MSYDRRGTSKLSKLGTQSLPSGITSEAILRFYEALDCARSLTAAILYRYKEYDQLVSLECDPSHYNSSESFRDAYLASSFLMRSKFLQTSFDRKALAISKFKRFEEGCAEVNRRLDSPLSPLNEFSGNGLLLSKMRRKIEKILGPFDPLELFELASWGPGVSNQIKGQETFAAKKFQYETGVTRDLHPLVRDLFPLAYPTWWESLSSRESFPSFEVGNAVITVPKTSKIDRVIAVEPGLNLWMQLGVGRMIRRRMGRVGIDLSDQGRNQQLAKEASLTSQLVTVDFSSASDSIASGLVRNLFSLPNSSRWFEVMDVCRSRYGRMDGEVFRWNKFSSMGNGFTFDLETLIFYAAAVVCCEAHNCSVSDVSVYGDDVIVPTECYATFCSLSEFLGFTVNKLKSFSYGSFRESCGAHYFKGVNCKPLFLVEELAVPVRVYNFANTLRLRAKLPYGCDARFRRLFYYLVGSVPKAIRFRVSATQHPVSGELEPLEGGFISNLDEACPQRVRHGVEGYHIARLSWVPVTVQVDYLGMLLAKLSGLKLTVPGKPWTVGSRPQVKSRSTVELEVSSMLVPWDFRDSHSGITPSDFDGLRESEEGNDAPLRSRTVCKLVKATHIRQWCDLGPWI